MDTPSYFPLRAEDIPSVTTPDGKVTVNIIAGEVLAKQGPTPTLTSINAATLRLYRKADRYIFLCLQAIMHLFTCWMVAWP